MWQKVKSWFKHSMTILWARIVAVSGALMAAALNLLDDQSVRDAVQTALQPQYIPYYVIAIGFITEMARRRSIGK